MSRVNLSTDEYVQAVAESLFRGTETDPLRVLFLLGSMTLHTVHGDGRITEEMLGTPSDALKSDNAAQSACSTSTVGQRRAGPEERMVILRRMVKCLLACDHSTDPMISFIRMGGWMVPANYVCWKRV